MDKTSSLAKAPNGMILVGLNKEPLGRKLKSSLQFLFSQHTPIPQHTNILVPVLNSGFRHAEYFTGESFLFEFQSK